MTLVFSRFFLFFWGACQVMFSWYLVLFFSLPDAAVGGEEVIYLFGSPIPVYKWGLPLPGGSMNLQTIVAIVAVVYLIIGVVQTLPLPKEARWRGTWIANLLTSLSVSGFMVWTWARLIWEQGYHITLFQQQVFWAFLFVSILDTLLFDVLIPLGRKVAAKVAVAPAPAGP